MVEQFRVYIAREAVLTPQAKASRISSSATVMDCPCFHAPSAVNDRVVTFAEPGASINPNGSSYSKTRRCSTPGFPGSR